MSQLLSYRVERKGKSLLVRLQVQGTKRVLYLDTLKAAAQKSDAEAVQLLIKIHLKTTRNPETLTFDRVEVPPEFAAEAIRLMRQTGRMVGEADKAPEPPLEVRPQLILTETSGSFATLWMDYGIGAIEFNDFAPLIQGRPRLKNEEAGFEKDLIEAGYAKKGDRYTQMNSKVGNLAKPAPQIWGSEAALKQLNLNKLSDASGTKDGDVRRSQKPTFEFICVYFCPKEKVKEALTLLLDVGWQVIDPLGKPLSKQIAIAEEKGRIAIRGQVRALIDPKLQMEGVWEGEVLYLKRAQAGSILQTFGEGAQWDETLLNCAKGFRQVEEAPPGEGFRGKLLPYQQKGVDWLSFLYKWGFSGLLADEMGLGKTVQVLAFLSRIRTNLPILIVAPTSLLFNWRLEIDRFLPGLLVELISYASLRLNDFSQKEYEIIIFDESNAIKTATTQTAKAAFQLKGKFKICMSGTPMENRMDEIWSQFHFLMPGLVERNSESLKSQVRPFILRRKKEDVQLDLPEKIEQIAWIEMGEEHKTLYEETKKGAPLDGKMAILEAILRLRQIANGAKIEQVLSDIKEALEERRKILVFSQFTSMLKEIHKSFPDALYLDGSTSGAKRGELVQTFQNDPDASLFLLSLKAGGVGLNLTAADYVFLIDPWWNEAVERQAIDRAHRIGRKNTVFAKRYLCLGTVEEKMLKLKEEKLKAADQLLDFEGGNFSEEDLLILLS